MKRQTPPLRQPDERRERVLAFAEAELRRDGVAFEELCYTPASGSDYDGLVIVWHRRHGRTLGVRLPDAA